jgi:hypothetical protein
VSIPDSDALDTRIERAWVHDPEFEEFGIVYP